VTTDTRALASDLSLAVVRLTRHLRGRRVDAQVSLTQLSALATLARDGAMTPGNLAAREKVQPPSMDWSSAQRIPPTAARSSSHSPMPVTR
jgi:hypothetical protein